MHCYPTTYVSNKCNEFDVCEAMFDKSFPVESCAVAVVVVELTGDADEGVTELVHGVVLAVDYIDIAALGNRDTVEVQEILEE